MCLDKNSRCCFGCRRSNDDDDSIKYVSSDNEIIVIGKREKKKRKKLYFSRLIILVDCTLFQPNWLFNNIIIKMSRLIKHFEFNLFFFFFFETNIQTRKIVCEKKTWMSKYSAGFIVDKQSLLFIFALLGF